jgi:hypothetical protein
VCCIAFANAVSECDEQPELFSHAKCVVLIVGYPFAEPDAFGFPQSDSYRKHVGQPVFQPLWEPESVCVVHAESVVFADADDELHEVSNTLEVEHCDPGCDAFAISNRIGDAVPAWESVGDAEFDAYRGGSFALEAPVLVVSSSGDSVPVCIEACVDRLSYCVAW